MVGAGPTVFAVWSYVIANTRPPGVVEINPVLLAAIIGTTCAEVESAMETLMKPDARSRSKEQDGRRLVKLGEFLYEVPTWAKYRATRNDEERRAYNREAQRKHREKLAVSNIPSMTVNDSKHLSAQADAEADVEAIKPPPIGAARRERGITEGKDSERVPTTEQSKRIATIFHRRHSTAWSEKEVAAYRKIGTLSPEDLSALESYYADERKKGDDGRHRRDLQTFLNNFQGELDRANQARKPKVNGEASKYRLVS
jgi:hypothetical protein